MRARAPASAANLGPGLDVLAVALQLYVEVDVVRSDHFSMRTEGEGADFPADRTHLAARVAIEVTGHDCIAIAVRSEIPVARGLGSSAALAVAAAAAAGADAPLPVAAAVDGHPENAAASTLGGLVAAVNLAGGPRAARLNLDPDLLFVVLVPDCQIATAHARQALPSRVPLADAIFNLGRLGLLVSGLANHQNLFSEATADRLHEPARRQLFPEGEALAAGMSEAGALAVCSSGSGPSILAITDRSEGLRLRECGEALLQRMSVGGQALLVQPDHVGVSVECTGSMERETAL